MNVGTLIKYLKVHAAQRSSPQGGSRSREQYLAFLDEAIGEAAKILIEQREPWMLTEWRFNIVANQTSYKLYLIAPTGALGTIDNFAILNSFFILSQAGEAWISYKVRPKIEAVTDAQPLPGSNTLARHTAHLELVPGHGGATGTEGDYSLVIENPPTYASVLGGRLSIFVLPSPVSVAAALEANDAYEPALPPYAWAWVKRHALKLLYLADGNTAAYGMLNDSKENDKSEARLRAGLGSGISDEPDYVTDVQADEPEFFP